jgi:tetrapyrrole methylase family protein/MazG family protein
MAQRRTARNAGPAFARLVRIMATLRSAHGCPWDRKQTHKTLRPFLIEEAYELLETIDRGRYDELPGELGDVLFQCVFHAQLGAETGRFDIVDAVNAITAKLIRRHPHVFTPSGRALGPRKKQSGTKTRARTAGAVLTQWEAIKAAEQGAKGQKKRLLAGVPAAMPSLLRAHEIGTRVAAVGFDWATAGEVIDKVDEEVREFREARTESRRAPKRNSATCSSRSPISHASSGSNPKPRCARRTTSSASGSHKWKSDSSSKARRCITRRWPRWKPRGSA